MGTGSVVFLVLAAAAPMAALVGAMPLGVALGNGAGMPGAFLLAAITLLLFASGYAAMSRHVTNAGAFAAYVSRGLGREPGAAAGYVALLAYNAMAVALAAGFGFFANSAFESVLSISLPWWVWCAGAVVVIAFLGYREIKLTAVALAISLSLEVVILLIFDVAVLFNHGFHGFSLEVFAPATIFSGAVGVALMYSFSSFVGFEATAIYAEEAKEPERTVARATYIALAVIGIFYTLTTWAAISSYGVAEAGAAAASEPALFMFGAVGTELGSWAVEAMEMLLTLSLFAGFLAYHQAASRYFFAMGRDGLLPARLSSTHARHGSPHVASALQIGFVSVVVAGLGLAGLDPYLDITAPALGFGTLGIIILQASTSIAVVAFFRRRSDSRWWTTFAAPALAAAGLIASAVLVWVNFDVLTGSSSALVEAMPWLYVAVAAVGVVTAVIRPHARIGRSSVLVDAAVTGDAPS
ncbi:MAG TPA: APC family permease [Solirubrobacterales bacterium]